MFVFFYLGCYLSVCHCYLGSILPFNIEIQICNNLWTKPLNQRRLIYEQFIYVLYLDLVLYISFVMNKLWLIDWLIDWLIAGWGALMAESKTGRLFSSEESQQHLSILELKAALFGLKALCNNFHNFHILIQIDKKLAMAAITKMGSTSRSYFKNWEQHSEDIKRAHFPCRKIKKGHSWFAFPLCS